MINFSSSKLWSAWLKLLVSFFLTLTRQIVKLWSTWLKLLVFFSCYCVCGFNSLKSVYGISQGHVECCYKGPFENVTITTKTSWRWQFWCAETCWRI